MVIQRNFAAWIVPYALEGLLFARCLVQDEFEIPEDPKNVSYRNFYRNNLNESKNRFVASGSRPFVLAFTNNW